MLARTQLQRPHPFVRWSARLTLPPLAAQMPTGQCDRPIRLVRMGRKADGYRRRRFCRKPESASCLLSVRARKVVCHCLSGCHRPMHPRNSKSGQSR